MAKKLIRVARTREVETFLPDVRYHYHPQAINAKEVRERGEEGELRECEFFLIDERDVQAVVAHFASAHPGKEVQVYGLEQVSVCPAAEMVTKQVTKEGILPV